MELVITGQVFLGHFQAQNTHNELICQSCNEEESNFDINDLLLRGHILHSSKTGKKNMLEKAQTHQKIFQ